MMAATTDEAAPRRPLTPRYLGKAARQHWFSCYGCGARFAAPRRTADVFCGGCHVTLLDKVRLCTCLVCGDSFKRPALKPAAVCDSCRAAMRESKIKDYERGVKWRTCLGMVSPPGRPTGDNFGDRVACGRLFVSQGPGYRFCPHCEPRRPRNTRLLETETGCADRRHNGDVMIRGPRDG